MRKKPIVILDLETTGLDTANDRIVQFSALKLMHDFSDKGEERDFLINPGMPIPAAATNVHGITDEMVKGKHSFQSHSRSIYLFLERCDIAGYNSIAYDIPLLSEEFARCGIEWPSTGTKFLDAMVIYKKMCPRDLSAALLHYCGLVHKGAHNAIEDIRATKMVIQSQMRQHPEISTPEDYSSMSMNSKAVDFAGKIILNDEGEAVFNFGKHKEKPVKYHLAYAEWMLDQDFPNNTKNVIRSIISTCQSL